MTEKSLKSLDEYSQRIVEICARATVEKSTISVWSASKYTGIAEGEIFFSGEYRLRMREELDFDEGIITSYGYEVYHGNKRLFWYDDFPHPNDASLASTYPHHKHIPPDIKHNRIPAQNLSFLKPNLPALVQEIERLLKALENGILD